MPKSKPGPDPQPPGNAPTENTGKKSLPTSLYETAVDVRNEAATQSANLYLAARRVLMASVGAVALTLEETNELLERLVDRGEVAETELSRIVTEYIERSNEREHAAMEMRRSTVDKATVALADSVEVILGRLNVPTRSDIEELSRKISRLNDKVTTLKAQRSGAASLPAAGAPPAEERQSLHANGGA